MKLVTKGFALMLILILTAAALPPASAEISQAPAKIMNTTENLSANADGGNSYSNYRKSADFSAAAEPIFAGWEALEKAQSLNLTSQADGDYGEVYSLEENSFAAFTVSVPANAAYTASLIFANITETAEAYEYSLKIDGKFSFDECEKLTLRVLWEDEGGVRRLSNGDEVAPSQKHREGFIKGNVTDPSGIALSPFEFYLTAGTHIITVTAKGKPFLLAGIELNPPEKVATYKEVSKGYGKYTSYAGPQIVIEAEGGENAPVLHRNAYSLSPKSDNSSANVSPHNAGRALINYTGGATWSEAGQEITWKFNAPEDGLYKLGVAFQQSTVTDAEVYRWLKIDGKTPFVEASRMEFPYGTGWQFKTLGDDKNDYLIYLSEGEHTLSAAVTLADAAEVYDRLRSVVSTLGALYLDIVMITGETPDANRDYELHNQIPGFTEILTNEHKALSALTAEIGVTLNVNTELSGAVKNMIRILKSMSDNLYSAHLYKSSYYNAYQTLSAWLYDILKMPLSIDQIILAAPEAEFETPRAGFFQRLIFGLRRFINSFYQPVNVMQSGNDEALPTIKLWVNWGRDQVKVLNTLIQDSFTPQNGVNVKVEQVNASLVQGVISGNSPDLYLHLARTEPVNLAMRGVLYNLENFDDFSQTLKNFQQGAEQPYRYKNGTYALPDTQSFYVMFYRGDILARLGIEVPKTWEDFVTATGILQRNNMNSYLPYTKISSATTVNTGAGGLTVYPTMLMQQGGSLYSEDEAKTVLDAPEALKAFTLWTEFYTKYSLDQEANFYQKFRIGTIPLGITSYTQYLTFKVAAPEIEGQWGIAEIPGEMTNGVINNTCSGSGTGCSIMKSSKEKEAAWKFLKWWVSADTQYRYSAENEAVLGETGRVATANVEAISRLSWDSESLKVILSQWNNVEEISEIPGSYFVSRAIDQAFWATKNGKSTCKEALVDWSEICNKEIARKRKEYE